MSKLHEAWLDYLAEEYPDETESEVLTPLAAAFEAGWMAAGASATGAEISACCPGSTSDDDGIAAMKRAQARECKP